MSRFLFVVPPLLGHLQPARGIASVLAARGHQIGWVGSESVLRPVLGDDAVIHRTGSRVHRPQADSGIGSLRSLWQEFIVSYTKFTRRAVAQAVAEFAPDVLVSDQHTPAGALAAYQAGLPWATLACSTIELTRPYAGLPRVEAWIAEQLDRICAAAGVNPAELGFDLRCSPHLVLWQTTPELAGPPVPPADGVEVAQVRQVGPCLGPRDDDPPFDWDWLDDALPTVLLTTGTLAAELAGSFVERALAALAPLAGQLQAVLVADPATVPDPPPHVLVAGRVPMLALLPRLSAVVCHGGLNTVNEALWFGVPLVVTPIRHDQPVNASLVAAAGAGIRLPFVRFTPDQLAGAIRTVLTDDGYRAAARRIGDSFAAAGGSVAAANHLEGLAETMPTNREPAYAESERG